MVRSTKLRILPSLPAEARQLPRRDLLQSLRFSTVHPICLYSLPTSRSPLSHALLREDLTVVLLRLSTPRLDLFPYQISGLEAHPNLPLPRFSLFPANSLQTTRQGFATAQEDTVLSRGTRPSTEETKVARRQKANHGERRISDGICRMMQLNSGTTQKSSIWRD